MPQKYEAIINYGLQNKKSKQEIIAALVKENELNSAGAYLKQLDEYGAFGGENSNNPDLNEGGPKVTAGTAQELGDSKAANAMLESLERSIESNKDNLGPIEGRVRGLNPYDTNAQSFQAQVNATKQIVGKYLEGGVLRLEDEKKYEKILPKLSDTPEVAKNKLAEVRRLIEEKYGSQIGTLGEGGYDISGFSQENKSPIEDQQQVADRLNKAVEYAKANPDDPQSKRFMDDWNNNRIDLVTGKLKDEFRELTPYEQKLKEQGLANPAQTAQPQQTIQPSPQPEQVKENEDNFLKRTWNATKEVVPGLIGDVGKRVKNIAGNIVEQSTKAKDRSVFENILKGQETMLRNLGEIGGGVGDVATRAMELAYKSAVPEETKEKIKQTAVEFFQTEMGQQAMGALQSGMEKYDEFKKANPNAAKDLEAAFNIVTALPAGKGLSMAGKEGMAIAKTGATIAEKTVGKAVGKDAVSTASKETFKAIKPSITVGRNKKAIRQTLNSANQEVIKRGFKPTNVKEYADALENSKKAVWKEIESKLSSKSSSKINLKEIADEIQSLADDPALLRADKAAAGKIKKMAENLLSQGDEIDILGAEKLKQFINSELSGAFGKFNLSNAEQNAKKILTKKIGEQMDKVISEIPGEFSDLKKKYGALRQIEEDVLKRMVVFERQNPQGLIESFSKVSGVGNILKGLVTASPSDIVKGAGEIALGQIQKRANNADVLVKKAFERLSKNAKGFQTDSKILNYFKGKRPGMNIQEVSPRGEEARRVYNAMVDEYEKATTKSKKKEIERKIKDFIKRENTKE